MLRVREVIIVSKLSFLWDVSNKQITLLRFESFFFPGRFVRAGKLSNKKLHNRKIYKKTGPQSPSNLQMKSDKQRIFISRFH